MTLDQTFEISPNVIGRDVDGELVLLNLENGLYFGLDVIGHQIWTHLEKGASLREAHADLLLAYDVAPDQLATDILALTQQLAERQLILASGA